MKITEEMVMELNNELANKGCVFRYELAHLQHDVNPTMKAVLVSMNNVDSFIINITDDFFMWLRLWFKVKGIELAWNNTRDIFWSRSGWLDE